MERDPEGEDQRHHQREIFADFRQQLDLGLARAAQLLHAEREANEGREYEEINDHRPEHEEDRRGDEIGQERLALVPI